jgi:hypothetical protein
MNDGVLDNQNPCRGSAAVPLDKKHPRNPQFDQTESSNSDRKLKSQARTKAANRQTRISSSVLKLEPQARIVKLESQAQMHAEIAR